MKNLKVKLIKDKPKKVYTANIEFDYHIKELCNYLTALKDKKFDIILNGHLIKIGSTPAKVMFVEGISACFNIVSKHMLDALKEFETDTKKLKEEYSRREAIMGLSQAALKDKIKELERTKELFEDAIKSEQVI